jgi:uncharacterized protein YqfB (UPF0267 family)
MIFQEHHREQIRSGDKTMTRRGWDSNQVTPGKTYRATLGGNVDQGMLVERSDCDCFIRVTDVYEQPLGEMSEVDADREGGYTLDELKETWEAINGEDSWDPTKEVWVVEYAGDSNPRERECEDGQSTMVDGG